MFQRNREIPLGKQGRNGFDETHSLSNEPTPIPPEKRERNHPSEEGIYPTAGKLFPVKKPVPVIKIPNLLNNSELEVLTTKYWGNFKERQKTKGKDRYLSLEFNENTKRVYSNMNNAYLWLFEKPGA